MRSILRKALLAGLILGVFGSPGHAAGMNVSHLYELSDFSGTITYSDVFLHADRSRDEIYATTGRTVRVFNAAGMEIYRFGDSLDLGSIYGLVVEDSGDIVLLTQDYRLRDTGREWSLTRCDYRGDPLELIPVEDLPDAFAGFSPDRMRIHDGDLVLVSSGGLQVVVVGPDGTFRRGHDLARLLNIEDRDSHDIFGFSLDASGNMLFTIPVLFKALIVSPDGTMRQFGSPGSAAGQFGIISGIAVDDHGNILVTDKLRHVVMVFNPSFQLITEIKVAGKETLVRPADVAVGGSGRVYVTQARQRGVAVYGLNPSGREFRLDGAPNGKGGGLEAVDWVYQANNQHTDRLAVLRGLLGRPDVP
jgi:hypothetical protein